MFVSLSSQQRESMSFVPQIKIYEDIPVKPTPWEYQVVTVDTNHRALPDEERLNALGSEGWFLVSILPQAPAGDTALVHYYFVRQIVK